MYVDVDIVYVTDRSWYKDQAVEFILHVVTNDLFDEYSFGEYKNIFESVVDYIQMMGLSIGEFNKLSNIKKEELISKFIDLMPSKQRDFLFESLEDEWEDTLARDFEKRFKHASIYPYFLYTNDVVTYKKGDMFQGDIFELESWTDLSMFFDDISDTGIVVKKIDGGYNIVSGTPVKYLIYIDPDKFLDYFMDTILPLGVSMFVENGADDFVDSMEKVERNTHPNVLRLSNSFGLNATFEDILVDEAGLDNVLDRLDTGDISKSTATDLLIRRLKRFGKRIAF